jgi:hypothetical protein
LLWYVVINASMANQVVDKQVLEERMKDLKARLTPMEGAGGGSSWRVGGFCIDGDRL